MTDPIGQEIDRDRARRRRTGKYFDRPSGAGGWERCEWLDDGSHVVVDGDVSLLPGNNEIKQESEEFVSVNNGAKIAAKMVQAAKEIGFSMPQSGKVTRKNGTTLYEYTTAEEAKREAGPALANAGIAVTVDFEVLASELVKGQYGEERYVEVKASLLFTDSESGESLTSTGLGSNQDAQAKAMMGAQTAAHRDAIFAAFMVGRGLDPEESTPPEQQAEPPRKRAQHREERAPAPPKRRVEPRSSGPSEADNEGRFTFRGAVVGRPWGDTNDNGSYTKIEVKERKTGDVITVWVTGPVKLPTDGDEAEVSYREIRNGTYRGEPTIETNVSPEHFRVTGKAGGTNGTREQGDPHDHDDRWAEGRE